MTEDEAKEKWCPMVRLGYANPQWPVGDNRTTEGEPAGGSLCIGSACMMWRWAKHDVYFQGETEGYCGFGGKP